MATESWWDDALPQCKGRGKEGEVAEEEVLRTRGPRGWRKILQLRERSVVSKRSC